MTHSGELRSGKGARDENFPVASWLIKPRHRPVILAFYEFVRVADDIADHPLLAPAEKLARLDRLEASLLQDGGGEPEGMALRAMLRRHSLPTRHAQDLLDAFRQDVTKLRYENWDELIDYCSRSAMPVGRFVLDVHGESHATWPANDALCAALQIINHLQDCAADYRKLDRVYIPLDALAAHDIGVEALAAERASPALRACLHGLAERTAALLQQSHGFDVSVTDTRLALEISVIQTLAAHLIKLLRARDPLSERVHLSKAEALAAAAGGGGRALLRRVLRFGPSDAPVSDAMNIQFPHMLGNQSPAATRAGGSSFYLAMRILDRERREAMFEVYSFCRMVDDIADGDAPREQRLAQLAEWRRAIEALYAGSVPPGVEKLAGAIQSFSLRKDDFLAVIDGVEMDAREDIRAPSLEQLELYVDRVASAVGRLCVRIFGMEDADGRALAHHLGRALQLTNILRDIDEDAAVGRLYLPREALRLAEIEIADPVSVVSNPRLGKACAFLADRVRGHFDQADAIMARSPHRVVRAPKIMGEVYRRMLASMVARGWALPRNRVHVNKPYLVWIALRHAFI